MTGEFDERQEIRRKTDEAKVIYEAVLREWLDEQFAKFGRWTLRGLMAMAFIVIVHLVLSMHATTLQAYVSSIDPLRISP